MLHEYGVNICEVICGQRGWLNVGSLVVSVFTSDGPPQLWSPLLPSVGQRASPVVPAPRRYGHMAAVDHHVNRCVSDSSNSHTAPFLLSVFPPSIKTDKVRLGLISPVADNRSLARPTKKLLFHHNRWQSEVSSDDGCWYLMLHLFHAFSLSQFS